MFWAIILSALFSFSSCSYDNDEELKLIPQRDVVGVFPNTITYVRVSSGTEPFTVISDDESIATGTTECDAVVKDVVIITGKSKGSTKLTVIDKNNEKCTISVNVSKGSYSLVVTDYQFNIEVPDDVTIKESIETDLRNNLPIPKNGIYYIYMNISHERDGLYVYPFGYSSQRLLGSFDFKDELFIFRYGDKNDINDIGRYQHEHSYSLVSEGEADEIVFIEDLTEFYREKYPDTNIIAISRKQFVYVKYP